MAMTHKNAKKHNNIIEDLKVSTILPSVLVIALYSPVPQWSSFSACHALPVQHKAFLGKSATSLLMRFCHAMGGSKTLLV